MFVNIKQFQTVLEKGPNDVRLLWIVVQHVFRNAIQQNTDRHSEWIIVHVVHQVGAKSRQVVQFNNVIIMSCMQIYLFILYFTQPV